MKNPDEVTMLYTCSDIDAQVLKEMLEENEIGAMVINGMNSGLAAGFSGGLQGIESKVFVADKDVEKAKVILEEFKNSFFNES
jgi:hypothetical protein